MPPSNTKGMHKEDIKAAIRKKGVSMSQLSLSLGLHESTVRRNICGMHMPHVEPLIARFIDKPLHEIWPDRWDTENIRIRPISNKKKAKASARKSHCKK